MPIFSLEIDGGFSTDAGPSAPFASKRTNPDGSIVVSVPWLIDAENIIFHLDGWPQKMPGATNVNSSATGATDSVMGVFDYWRATTSGAPVQKRIIYAGTAIFKEDIDGVFDSLKTGLDVDQMPAFEVMNDDLVTATTSTLDVPQKYDQSTIADLGGSPPNFSFHVEHKDRMWAAGVNASKSRLHGTVLGDHEDWTGSGSVTIDVSQDDGDIITGLRSHKDELIIFKGPHSGSIHRLAGSSPTGSDAFTLHPFINTGVGSTNHQSIIGARDDLWFWDDNGIHSLVATAAFGDYNEAFLSRSIGGYFADNLNHNRLNLVWGVNFASRGYALWTVSRSGLSSNNLIIGLDYRFTPMRFFLWPDYNVASLAMVRDTSREAVPWAGTYTGRALRMNRSVRSIAGSAYTYKVTMPYMPFGDPFFDKTVMKGRVGFQPKGEFDFTFLWQRDDNTQQSATVSEEGSVGLGSATNQFVLGTSRLGGVQNLNQFFDMEGSFKEIQLQLTKGTVDEDFEPHSIAIEVEAAGMGTTGTIG